ncbi:MAG: glyoxalase/bleomycin resistance/dioxygenase family protein [Polaromonas sp.]|nr:glyoxalase/bleomycin resistance/dioxygenase family protein [Polaromonas sp.]
MKRFHVHLHVADLAASLAFYNRLFAAEPARVEADYAKWMLTDPPLNFAISTRGSQPGLDHFGFQVDQAEELAALKAQAQAADMALLDEGETTCCYARSDKYWVTDPQGVAWEQFHTLDTIPTFSEATSTPHMPPAQSCCAPTAPDVAAQSAGCGTAEQPAASAGGCCPPAKTAATGGGCCAPVKPAAPTGGCCGPSASSTKAGCC